MAHRHVVQHDGGQRQVAAGPGVGHAGPGAAATSWSASPRCRWRPSGCRCCRRCRSGWPAGPGRRAGATDPAVCRPRSSSALSDRTVTRSGSCPARLGTPRAGRRPARRSRRPPAARRSRHPAPPAPRSSIESMSVARIRGRVSAMIGSQLPGRRADRQRDGHRAQQHAGQVHGGVVDAGEAEGGDEVTVPRTAGTPSCQAVGQRPHPLPQLGDSSATRSAAAAPAGCRPPAVTSRLARWASAGRSA